MLALLGSLKKANIGGVATNSLRLRSSNSAYLSRTLATPTSSTVFTWSAWLKRGSLGGTYRLFGASTTTYLTFNSSDQLNLTLNGVSSATTTAVFRDPSSWYHVVYTQNGSAQTIYVNGNSVATGTTANTVFNTAIAHQIGAANTLNYFDGYLTEVYFIDGQALTPSSFGQINSTTGVWSPKQFVGTYGTNGFYLKFADASAATAAAIGKDSSGNGNNWTPNGISVTAGVTYDSMLDVPNNYADGGNGRGNYAVLSPLNKGSSLNITNADLSVNASGASIFNQTFSTIGVASGLWYFEVNIATNTNGNAQFGVATPVASPNTYPGQDTSSWGVAPNTNQIVTYVNGASTVIAATGNALTGTFGVAFDASTGKLWVTDNSGAWVNSGNPVAGTGAAITGIAATNGLLVSIGHYSVGSQTTAQNINFGQRPFTYTPPTGFLALNTQNLPTPAIANGASVMAATTYTGTGSALTITNTNNGVSFQPDFVWMKGRSGATDHALYDVARGTTKDLVSNSTAIETTQATGLTAFNADGFTIGALAKLNTAAATYIAWQWKAGGAAVSNTAGTVTSQVSANQTSGISVVTFNVGVAGSKTIGHGLGIAPKFIVCKSRTSTPTNWSVYHASVSTTVNQYMTLNSTSALQTTANIWGAALPTSTVFGFNSGVSVVANDDVIAYCFSEIAGFSKFGSWVNNNSTDGTFIYLGFRPRFIILKNTDNVENWFVWDSTRQTYNVTPPSLNWIQPNTSNSQGPNIATTAEIDGLSNGFKIRTTDPSVGEISFGTRTYIFAAFAENPSKYALAR